MEVLNLERDEDRDRGGNPLEVWNEWQKNLGEEEMMKLMSHCGGSEKDLITC